MSATSATTPDTASNVEGYVRALFEGCAAALSTLLSRSVAIDLDGALRPPAELTPETLGGPWFVAQARFTRGVPGAHDFIFAQDEAVDLAKLVMGDTSELGPVTSDHEDALREMLNQMLSSASSALKVFLNRPTALSLVELRRVDGSEGWTPHSASVALARVLVDGVPRARLGLTMPDSVRDEVTAAKQAAEPARASGSTAIESTAGLAMILDITMPITVELGRTRMLIRDILSLSPGSVVELDKMAGEPVDLLVNDRPIAKGEVVVIDENFGVRLTQITQPAERIRSLR